MGSQDRWTKGEKGGRERARACIRVARRETCARALPWRAEEPEVTLRWERGRTGWPAVYGAGPRKQPPRKRRPIHRRSGLSLSENRSPPLTLPERPTLSRARERTHFLRREDTHGSGDVRTEGDSSRDFRKVVFIFRFAPPTEYDDDA